MLLKHKMKLFYKILSILILAPVFSIGQNSVRYSEQEAIDLMKTIKGTPFQITENPQAQWFPDAGLGLFIHWGIHSVAALDPSWTMIKNYPGLDLVMPLVPKSIIGWLKSLIPLTMIPKNGSSLPNRLVFSM